MTDPNITAYPIPRDASARHGIVWGARAVSYLVYAYVVVVEVILLIGFVLKLFGANPTAGFVEWWYRSLDRVMAPFRGIFTSVELGASGNDVPAVLDTSILFAMVVYAVVLLGLRALIDWLSYRIQLLDDQQRLREVMRAQEIEAARRAQAAQFPSQFPGPGTAATQRP